MFACSDPFQRGLSARGRQMIDLTKNMYCSCASSI